MQHRIVNAILATLLLFLQDTYSQPPIHTLRKLTALDGLSSNMTTDLLEDSRGFLWITTYYGLNRYDGSEVTKFYVNQDSTSLAGNVMYRIIELDDKRLAIATHDGLLIFNSVTYEQKKVKFDHLKMEHIDSSGRQFINQITSLEKDESGNLWAWTPICLYRLDSALKVQKIFWSGYTQNEIATKRINFVERVFPLKDGAVLIWLDRGVFIWKRSRENDSDELVPIELWQRGKLKFLKDQSGFSAFGTKNGNIILLNPATRLLFLVDIKTGRKVSCEFSFDKGDIAYLQNISHLNDSLLALSFDRFGFGLIRIQETGENFSILYQNRKYFLQNKFGRMIVDREKNIWATTMFEGLIGIPYQKQLFSETVLPEVDLTDKTLYQVSCFFRKENKIYVGCGGSGIYEWNMDNGSITHLLLPAMPQDFGGWIWNIREGARDTLWIGTGSGLFWFDLVTRKYGRPPHRHPDDLEKVAITTQFTDSHGLVWMGLGLGKGLTAFDPKTNNYIIYSNNGNGYPYRYPLAIAEDSKKNLWFISDNSPDLVMWDRKENRFIVHPVALGGRSVWGTIYIDKDDCIWFGLHGAGLICYDIRKPDSAPRAIDTKAFSDCWGDIAEDRNGRLWLTSNNGPVCYDKRSGHVMQFETEGPLFVTDNHSPVYFDSATGKYYMGFFKKIISFKPDEIRSNEKPLQLYLTGLNVFDKGIPVPPDRKIRLGPKQNDITIFFTGLNLSNGDENRYAYKFSGSGWNEIGNQKQIHFARLTPGNYSIEIRAARSGEDWSPLSGHLLITIVPPFTRTVWFYLCILAAASLLIYAWYRHRLNQFIRLRKVRSEISGDLHDELGSRLTSLSYMSLIALKKTPGNEELAALLNKINQNSMKVSASLREIIWGINPELDKLNRLIPHLRQYAAETLELREIEFVNVADHIPDRFKLNQKARRDLELIFKEAMNNILKHSCAQRVTMTVSHGKKYLKIIIQDDGKGFRNDGSLQGNGLNNIRKRAAVHHWNLQLTSAEGQGTIIALDIKIT